MQAIIFIGAQSSGKSSFYLATFFRTHVRLNLDMLRTRHRERLLLEACLNAGQRFVVDNTNPTRSDRARYIPVAREAGFRVVGYYFQSKVSQCLAWNAARPESDRVPDRAILGTCNKIEIPSLDEDFDELYYVRSVGAGDFSIEEWRDEV